MHFTYQDLIASSLISFAMHISIYALSCIAIYILINYAFRSFIKKHHEHSKRYVILKISRAPMIVILMIIITEYFLHIVYSQHDNEFIRILHNITHTSGDILIILLICTTFIQIVSALNDLLIKLRIEKNEEVDYFTLGILSKSMKAIVIVIGLIRVLSILGFDLRALLAVGGAGGIIIGLAAKDFVSNFFGVITIYLDKPFIVKEWIKILDSTHIEGIIEEIGWRVTKIRLLDKHLVYIPNATFLTAPIENISRMSHRRINESLRIKYKDKESIPKIIDAVKDNIEKDDRFDTKQAFIVNAKYIGKDVFDMWIYAFAYTTSFKNFYPIKQDVTLTIAEIVSQYDAEIIYNNPDTSIYQNCS